MSQFIKTEHRSFYQPLLDIPNKQIVSAKYRKIKNCGSVSRRAEKDYIKNLYQDFSEKERNLINQKNDKFMKTQYQKMKR